MKLKRRRMEDELLKAPYDYVDLNHADLEGAYLDSANLFNIKNKEIFTFQASQHFAYACDGYIKIGCMVDTVENWLRAYKDVGAKYGYSTREIKLYGNFIASIANLD